MKKITVIIPTYNAEHLLKRSVDSILAQTYTDLEIILVDDKSTDKTAEVIKDCERKDSRIRSIFLEKNSGGPATPKTIGVKNAESELIAFLDQDDEWLPEKLERQYEYLLSHKDAVLVGTTCLNVNASGEKTRLPISTNTEKILTECIVHSSSSVLMRKSIFTELGYFDPNFTMSDDWDLWIRIFLAGYRLDFIDEPLFLRHIHENNVTVTSSAEKRLKNYEYLVQKHQVEFKKRPEVYSKWLRNLGTYSLLANKTSAARKYIKQAVSIKPRSPRGYINLLLVYVSPALYLRLVNLKRSH